MKAKELRTVLADKLSNLNAYYGDNVGEFSENTYKINYQIQNATLDENQRTYVIDIDVYSDDTIAIDDICDEIESILDFKSFNYKNDNYCTFFLTGRINTDDKTKDIKRVTLSYEVRTYDE